jgi:hypothetical protein
MFKSLIRHWFNQWEQEPRAVPSRPSFDVGMRVIPIRNGYLVQVGAHQYDEPALTYCKDAKEIAEAVISIQAETKLAASSQRSISDIVSAKYNNPSRF